MKVLKILMEGNKSFFVNFLVELSKKVKDGFFRLVCQFAFLSMIISVEDAYGSLTIKSISFYMFFFIQLSHFYFSEGDKLPFSSENFTRRKYSIEPLGKLTSSSKTNFLPLNIKDFKNILLNHLEHVISSAINLFNSC